MQHSVLFIYRDGTIVKEPPTQICDQLRCLDVFDRLEFLPGVIRNLFFIRKNLDFKLVLVTNRDGTAMPVDRQEFDDRVQRKMLEIFSGEGIIFDDIAGDYDLKNSYVIGNRESDMQLAVNLGCKGILIESPETRISNFDQPVKGFYPFNSWDQVTEMLFAGERQATVQRTTKETDILVRMNIDGNGVCDISTGIGFFDHLLEQIGKHGGLDLTIKVKGDLHVDEHHTVEDTAIALGEALYQALGNKRGIERYGFCLPMDDCLCCVTLDFGGRAWLVWDAVFKREKIGDLPTEMIYHFQKSFSDAAKMNLNIKAEGENEHHKAESIFKALARAIKAAVRRDIYKYDLPSTKGVL